MEPVVNTKPRLFAFVLMPFSSSFNDLYELGIKQACRDEGWYCERVDEQNYDGPIIERIFNQIAKADVIIAVMTGQNPNVFFEVGYAYALGQRVILITSDAKEIPFDLNQYSHIVYNDSLVELKKALGKKLAWAMSHPAEPVVEPAADLEFFIDGREIVEGETYEVSFAKSSFATFIFIPIQLEVFNGGATTTSGDQVLALQTSVFYQSEHCIRLPGLEYHLNYLSPVGPLFPESWGVSSTSLQWVLSGSKEPIMPIPVTLVIFTENGKREIEFFIHAFR